MVSYPIRIRLSFTIRFDSLLFVCVLLFITFLHRVCLTHPDFTITILSGTDLSSRLQFDNTREINHNRHSHIILPAMCCGSEDDYYTVSPYRPENERPHPSVAAAHTRQNPQRQYQTPNRDEAEKRQRQEQAAAAARNYGWPTARGVNGNIYTNNRERPENRDSMIEPDLAGGLAAMPGSDFRAVYDPNRARQQQVHRPSPPDCRPSQPIHRPSQPIHRQGQPINKPNQPVNKPGQPISRPSQPANRPSQPTDRPSEPVRRLSPPPPYQRPAYYQYSYVDKQPAKVAPMRAEPKHGNRGTPHQRPSPERKPVIQTVRPILKAPQVAEIVCSETPRQQPGLVRKPVSKTVRPILVTPQVAEIVQVPEPIRRRDSNGVSECSDDDMDVDLSNYTVSPLESPVDSSPPVYPRRGVAYGRNNGAF
ncbi:hypothetical protein F4861DRAFT_490531 [Xylaria intraflava]|nr:hypothetical protein F4861DRAFT_490531 [Xylaria intraflava]